MPIGSRKSTPARSRGPLRAGRMVTWLGWLGVIGVVASGALMLGPAAPWLRALDSGDPAAGASSVRPVRHVTVAATGGRRTRTFSGVARAGVESSLSFRVPGVIAAMAVDVGDRVRPGRLLAELDPVDYELRVREAEAALRQTQAAAGNAGAELRRLRRLYESDSVSRADFDAAVTAVESAAAGVDSAERRLELVQRQVDHTRLAAPVEGAIADVLIEANEAVAAGQPVLVLTSGAEPEVGFVVPEGLIRQVREGSSAAVVLDAIPGKRFAGVVTEVGVMATAAGTTFPVTVRLDADSFGIRSGMAAEVALDFDPGGAADRFVVPTHAVAEDRDGRFVYVAEPAGDGLATVRRRAVSVGAFAPGGIDVVDGLADGEAVVTAGMSRLRDGDRVRLGTGGAR